MTRFPLHNLDHLVGHETVTFAMDRQCRFLTRGGREAMYRPRSHINRIVLIGNPVRRLVIQVHLMPASNRLHRQPRQCDECVFLRNAGASIHIAAQSGQYKY